MRVWQKYNTYLLLQNHKSLFNIIEYDTFASNKIEKINFTQWNN
jgi:hypothetical protein